MDAPDDDATMDVEVETVESPPDLKPRRKTLQETKVAPWQVWENF